MAMASQDNDESRKLRRLSAEEQRIVDAIVASLRPYLQAIIDAADLSKPRQTTNAKIITFDWGKQE